MICKYVSNNKIFGPLFFLCDIFQRWSCSTETVPLDLCGHCWSSVFWISTTVPSNWEFVVSLQGWIGYIWPQGQLLPSCLILSKSTVFLEEDTLLLRKTAITKAWYAKIVLFIKIISSYFPVYVTLSFSFHFFYTDYIFSIILRRILTYCKNSTIKAIPKTVSSI